MLRTPTKAQLAAWLRRMHRSERGAEGLEKLLIVAAVVLPLLAVLIIFRNKISEWVNENWTEVKSDADNTPQID